MAIVLDHQVISAPAPQIASFATVDVEITGSFNEARAKDLARILATFPADGPMQNAVAFCPGLRLLQQDPWECLASFILSSTKQIVQIQQIVSELCHCFGTPLASPPDGAPVRGASPVDCGDRRSTLRTP